MCVCMSVLRTHFIFFFQCLSHSVYFFHCMLVCVCMCPPLILASKEEGQNNGENKQENGLIIRRECACVCTSPHCLQKHKVDNRGKIDCNNREQEDSLLLLLPPLHSYISLSFPFLSHSLCFNFSQFINIYQC